MSDLDYILLMLRSDLRALTTGLAFWGLLWLLPACFVSFVAAARTEPTLWRDLPLGIFWGWLAGIPTLLASLGILVGLILFVGQFGESFITAAIIIGGSVIAAIVANYRTAVWYYQRRIKKRLGWQLSEPQPQPANRWYSFSLRKLLVAQIALVLLFSIWLAVRRDEIRQRRNYAEMEAKWKKERDEERAYKEGLVTRFGSFGWDFIDRSHDGLRMTQYQGMLHGFHDDVLERLTSQDQLRSITLRSDQLTDAGLEILSRNSELTDLEIISSRVTDRGIAHLAKLKKLERLRVSCPQLTERALEELEPLKNINLLTIYSLKIPKNEARSL